MIACHKIQADKLPAREYSLKKGYHDTFSQRIWFRVIPSITLNHKPIQLFILLYHDNYILFHITRVDCLNTISCNLSPPHPGYNT